MADGDLLRGKTHFPLYGKNGTLLYKTTFVLRMGFTVEISPLAGLVLDSRSFFTGTTSKIGGHTHTRIRYDGFCADWISIGGEGESKIMRVWYDPESAYTYRRTLDGEHFEIHLAWNRYGNGESETGGPARVIVTDDSGVIKSLDVTPWAEGWSVSGFIENAPGAMVNFNADGSVNSITLI